MFRRGEKEKVVSEKEDINEQREEEQKKWEICEDVADELFLKIGPSIFANGKLPVKPPSRPEATLLTSAASSARLPSAPHTHRHFRV